MKTFLAYISHNRNRGSYTEEYIISAENVDEAREKMQSEVSGDGILSLEEIDISKPYFVRDID